MALNSNKFICYSVGSDIFTLYSLLSNLFICYSVGSDIFTFYSFLSNNLLAILWEATYLLKCVFRRVSIKVI